MDTPEGQAQIESNSTLMIVLAYYLFTEENYNKLLQLINKTQNLELLSLKLVTYLRINRVDLAEKALANLKRVDEDNCLTGLATIWLKLYKCGLPS